MRSAGQKQPQVRSSILFVAKVVVAIENYLGDCATFVSPATVPMAGLNNVLAGAGALSVTDLRRATGQACGIAMSVCKPMTSGSPYGTYNTGNVDVAKYAALAKAFDSLAAQGGVT